MKSLLLVVSKWKNMHMHTMILAREASALYPEKQFCNMSTQWKIPGRKVLKNIMKTGFVLAHEDNA